MCKNSHHNDGCMKYWLDICAEVCCCFHSFCHWCVIGRWLVEVMKSTCRKSLKVSSRSIRKFIALLKVFGSDLFYDESDWTRKHIVVCCMILIDLIRNGLPIYDKYSNSSYLFLHVSCRRTETLSDIQEQHEDCCRNWTVWSRNGNVWCITICRFDGFVFWYMDELCRS